MFYSFFKHGPSIKVSNSKVTLKVIAMLHLMGFEKQYLHFESSFRCQGDGRTGDAYSCHLDDKERS